MENEAKKQKKICTPEETLQPLNVNDVVSVYEGKAGGCWCCGGEHFFNPAFTKQIAEYVSEGLLIRPTPTQFNQEKINAITGLVNTHIECGVTYSLGEGFYLLELNGLKYHVLTTAECAFRREILREGRSKTSTSN